MIQYYILENGLPKKTDMETWAKWVEKHEDRELKRTQIPDAKIEVITVFFPLPETDFDMGYDPIEGEVCREKLYFYGTMVFGGRMNNHEEKYRTREEAEDGHERILAKVKAVLAGKEEPDSCCRHDREILDKPDKDESK